jgi:hypothetical protein
MGTTTLVRNGFPPLAWDRHDQQFEPPDGSLKWKVRRVTGGRPVAMRRDGKPVLVELYASMEEFEEEIDWQDGVYRLYPVDEHHNEIPHGQTAHVVISPPEGDTTKQDYLSRIDRSFDVVDRLIASHEHKDVLLSDITKTLVRTQTDLQRGAGELLGAATTTIRVANGVEGLERQPAPDMKVDEFKDMVAAMLEEQKKPESSGPPWFVQIINGPVGMAAIQFVQNFARGMAQAQAQAAQAQAAPAQAEPKA